MLEISDVRHLDMRAGRLLAGMTPDELAGEALVTARTVRNVEAGDNALLSTRVAVLRALEGAGVRFVAHGRVLHVDGRIAPTHEAVGTLRGERLRKARLALGLALRQVSVPAHLTGGSLERLERSTHDLTQAPTLGFYRLVGVLQLAGYSFGPWRLNHISGDRLLIEPPRRAKPAKDRARYHTKGLAIPGFPRRLDEFEGQD